MPLPPPDYRTDSWFLDPSAVRRVRGSDTRPAQVGANATGHRTAVSLESHDPGHVVEALVLCSPGSATE
jgi:hypothetical protein